MLFTCGRTTKTDEKIPRFQKYTDRSGRGLSNMGCKGEILGARLNSNTQTCQNGLGKNDNYLPRQPMSSEYLCIYLVSTCIAALSTCDGGNLISQREIHSQLGILHINILTR